MNGRRSTWRPPESIRRHSLTGGHSENIFRVKPGQGIKLTGTFSEALSALKVGQAVANEYPLGVPADGTVTYTLEAKDLSGNSTRVQVKVITDSTAPQLTVTSPSQSAFISGAGLDPVKVTSAGTVKDTPTVIRLVDNDGGADSGRDCDHEVERQKLDSGRVPSGRQPGLECAA